MFQSGVVAICVYVFKQKTAYDLRISDWSSDVCSSDLLLDDREQAVPHHLHADAGEGIDGGHGALLRVSTRWPRPSTAASKFGVSMVAVSGSAITAGQIGRASCRERVCQYV